MIEYEYDKNYNTLKVKNSRKIRKNLFPGSVVGGFPSSTGKKWVA